MNRCIPSRAIRAVLSVVAGLFVLAATAAPARAQYFGQNKVQYEKLNFQVIKTPHFDVYYYDEEKEAAQIAARLAERWYARLSTILVSPLMTLSTDPRSA